ncbi:MAG TPA: YggS family pyridoxal phosphate-dependent enzyme, partial [Candidatus Wirthbacteria bacterium]|nr:YggS family pyridoxal phosphate-dependent enzyme [Candidatus Wirthbacteria bacterium]
HLIGHLQTNKVKKAIQLFEVIHSVDSLRLAQEISKQAVRLERQIEILLEVNIAGENSKYGCPPEQLSVLLEQVLPLPGLIVKGLMCMAPLVDEPEQTRVFFTEMKKMQLSLQDRFFIQLPWLSMGMSQDYEVAIEEGATHVRVGSALFV